MPWRGKYAPIRRHLVSIRLITGSPQMSALQIPCDYPSLMYSNRVPPGQIVSAQSLEGAVAQTQPLQWSI
jgi:hypothetical protein